MSPMILPRLGRTWLSSSVRTLIVPAGIGEPTKTITEVVKSLSEDVIGGPTSYDPEKYEASRRKLLDKLPRSQAELPTRRMADSFDHAIIPLNSDKRLRDRYLTHSNNVRVGRLMEDMDIFAVSLVYNHLRNSVDIDGSRQSPYSIVTALVDRMDIFGEAISPDEDVKMSGHVTWVGKSSAEATLELHQLSDGAWRLCTEASFVMVARDPLNRGNGFVNPLAVDTDEEKRYFARGEHNKRTRKDMGKVSLLETPPTESEKVIIHDFFIKTLDFNKMSFKARVKPDKAVWMEDSKLKNLVICQPENRNRFNKIFGGFLMRLAFELAYANAWVYSRCRPSILHMDDILFQAPVEVGSLLYFNSQVCYTEANLLQVRVSAEVLEPATGRLEVTNVFMYTFRTDADVPPIMPKTYAEAMMYLNGRRHFNNSMGR